MFCALVGLGLVEQDHAKRKEGLDGVVNLIEQQVVSVNGASVKWRNTTPSCVVHDEETGTPTLLLMAACDEPATADDIVLAVTEVVQQQQQLNNKILPSCELWASCPAPLPLEGVETRLRANNDGNETKSSWEEWGAAVMQEWGMVLQKRILEPSQVAELRLLVDEAIDQAERAINEHRPEITIGQDTFCFAEIASRGKERFDLRLTDSLMGAFVEKHVLGQPRVQALMQHVLNSSLTEIDFDMSVVYSKPGAVHQGWHADGDHQKGALDAGWEKDGWRTQLAGAYAICLFIPLIDLDNEVGFTQFWPGSHRNRDLLGFGRVAELAGATVDGVVLAGDGIWYDYRLFHRGMPNLSNDTLRPVVQIIFKKKWYIEKANYGIERIVREQPNKEKTLIEKTLSDTFR